MSRNEISYAGAIRQALIDEMSMDANVILIGEDIGVYGGAFGVTQGLLDQFGPERVLCAPISEGSFTGLAIGAALRGARPVVEIMFMDFATLTMDQLINQAAKLRYVLGEQAKCPVVVRMVGGAGRNYGPTHSQNLEAHFVHTPGLKVFAPGTVEDAYTLTRAAIRDDNPVILLEHKLLYPMKATCDLNAPPHSPVGSRRLLSGDDATIVAYSRMSVEAVAAGDALRGEGIEVDVIDLRFLSPIDAAAIIESAKRTGRVVVAAEDCRTGGVAAEIACRVFEAAHDYLDAPIKRLTTPDVPIPATPSLENAAIPNRDDIHRAVLEMIEQ